MPATVLALLAARDSDTRQMYAEYLRQFTYEIDEAEDGPEALAKAMSRHPTVIATDSQLPRVSGLELCRLLRSDVLTRSIPIIVMTELIAGSHARIRRRVWSREHQRRDTTRPPAPPPALVCPACDWPLGYTKSHIGGVSERNAEQWDYFECARGCGRFQYRQRTRKVRHLG